MTAEARASAGASDVPNLEKVQAGYKVQPLDRALRNKFATVGIEPEALRFR
jgi:hypothetical protein